MYKVQCCDTIEGKEEYVFSAFDKLTTYIKSIKTNKAFDIYQYMLTNVVEHYNEDISLNDISYRLGLSSPYLSNVFKEFHNTNFLDYLNGYRITKTKELLTSSELSINDISAKVGYSNVNTFIRVFKKNEGITPWTVSHQIKRELDNIFMKVVGIGRKIVIRKEIRHTMKIREVILH